MLRIAHPPNFGPERRYVLDVVLREFLGLDYSARAAQRSDTEISLEGSDGQIVVADALFAIDEADRLSECALPNQPLARWRIDDAELAARLVSPTLPVLFGSPPWLEGEQEVRLGIDIFGGVFWMLTRAEEVIVPATDPHGRFPCHASLAQTEGFLRRPLANEYVELLWWALQRRWPRLRRTPRTFRERLTHDVDWPLCARSTLRGAAKIAAGDVVRRRDPALAVRQFTALAGARRGSYDGDPCNTFDLIMDLSEQRDLVSAFYFLTGHTNPYDGGYASDEPWIRTLLRRIHARGHEIGLHPSYATFDDPARTRSELATLEEACREEGIAQPIRGGRQHYLRWRNPVTWQNWEDAGLEYDSTLGFSERPGFRCGVCYEFPTFNLSTRRPLRLRERPLIVMDGTLLIHRRLDRAAVLTEISELKNTCRKFSGDLTLLWHNSLLTTRYQKRLYRDALDLA